MAEDVPLDRGNDRGGMKPSSTQKFCYSTHCAYNLLSQYALSCDYTSSGLGRIHALPHTANHFFGVVNEATSDWSPAPPLKISAFIASCLLLIPLPSHLSAIDLPHL